MKTVYLSLPISGLDIERVKEQANEFREFAHSLHSDWNIVTPFDICVESGRSYGCYMGKDIEFIIDHADAILFAPYYGDSLGCRLEYEAATIYRKECYYLSRATGQLAIDEDYRNETRRKTKIKMT